MKKLLLTLTLVAAAAGCRSNPYCLNCKDSGNGVITPEDMIPEPTGDDMAGTNGGGADMTGTGGPCVPTNGGIEICDGLDNDCNGAIDDVSQDRLVGDPKNCGACGNECKFTHAFGQCIGGFDGGMPTCQENGCQPGYVDLDGDPTNGCEYACTPTTPSTEVCDGKDNNCDGQVDEGFTTSWFDTGHKMPKYDSQVANCGQCGTVCNLGPGSIMACQGTGTNGQGQCNVIACFNGNDANGVHQTYRHLSAQPINQTGCEYHCPKPATQSGVDCNPNGACTFPAETCNGVDDDCDGTADNNVTDPLLNPPGQACPDGMTGKFCTGAACGVGACSAGTVQCGGAGGLVCVGSKGPSAETCNGKDDDCDGQVDQPFTTTWQDANKQMPRYDKDVNNCGGCTVAGGTSFKCALPNAINMCRVLGSEKLASCAVASCNAGFNYVNFTQGATSCNVPAPGPESSCNECGTNPADPNYPKVTGVGCFYSCTSSGGETCNGADDDCNGCVDDNISPPPNFCNDTGACKSNHSIACQQIPNSSPAQYAWVCTYGPGVDTDPNGNLSSTEKECDNVDNNCNGACDETFPDVQVKSINNCTNPHAAKACSGGKGVCQQTGTFGCYMTTSEQCEVDPTVAMPVLITSNGDLTKATDEKCNGKDDDCNGLIDESTDYTPTGTMTTFKGWHDPTVLVNGVYVYAYEASRPDATGTSPGSSSVRACSNAGVLPWANVTLAQAQAACSAIKDSAGNPMRVCTANEWQLACNGNQASGTHWSMSSSTTSYVSQVCNDANQTDQRCSDTTKVGCTKSCNSAGKCTCTADADCPGRGAGSCNTATGVCTMPAGTTCPGQCLGTCDSSGYCECSIDADCNPGFKCDGTVTPKRCTGLGAWPTGSTGTNTSGNQCHTVEPNSAGNGYDFSGNLQEWTSTTVTVKSGTSWTLAATGTSGQFTLSGLSNMLSSDAGAQITLTGASNSLDNGTWSIVSYVSSTSVVVAIPNGAAPATGSSTTPPAWHIDYYKLRGGNFNTTSSGGDSCEFDFDIQRATFVNTNVGFRCCSDAAP